MGRSMRTRNNKGFSLVEVMVSMAILSLILIPLLSYFISSAKTNAIAKNMQRANLAAQQVIEDLDAYASIEDIAKEFNIERNGDPVISRSTGWKELKATPALEEAILDSDRSYIKLATGGYQFNQRAAYYFTRPIDIDGITYEALITLDTSGYAAINTELFPDIKTINGDGNAVVVEGYQTEHMVSSVATVNAMYCANAPLSSPPPSPLPTIASEAEIRSNLKRNIHVELSSDGVDEVLIKVYYHYTCLGIDGCNSWESKEYLYNEKLKKSEFQNIYLFFNSMGVENLIEINDTGVGAINPYNFYIVSQVSGGAVPASSVKLTTNGDRKLGTIFSNINVEKDGTPNQEKTLISLASRQRMGSVKVEIFKTGTNFTMKYAELNSTKGE